MKPEMAPIVLTRAIPPAAPDPARKDGGRYQKTGKAAKSPMAVTVMTAMVVNGEFMYSATGTEMPATSIGPATCQIRSPLRSECLDHKIMATEPAAKGTATISPVWMTEK